MGRSLKESKDQAGLYNLGPNAAIPHFGESRHAAAHAAKPEDADDPTAAASRAGSPFLSGVLRGAEARQRLSLDDVKVVRNDLSDSDCEVVARARPAVTGRDATFEKREVAGWRRLTERLFHIGAAPAPAPTPRQSELIART
jgi:hypothetical protein